MNITVTEDFTFTETLEGVPTVASISVTEDYILIEGIPTDPESFVLGARLIESFTVSEYLHIHTGNPVNDPPPPFDVDL